MNVAYRLLARRDRSILEIREALKKRDFEEDTIKEVISRLVDDGYLNDRKFATLYGSSLSRNRKVGPNYIMNKLIKKGVDRKLADEAIAEIFSNPEDTENQLHSLIEKKMSRMKDGLSPIHIKKRLYDFLAGKGFGSDAILKAINKRKLF
ncbi:MAG: recombination regulator RecX [Nitrospinota bacterium]|nr:recombination regulator RecX [Nitrospinota bacterium]